MRKWLLVLSCIFFVTPTFAETNCDDDADMTDSLEFDKVHNECAGDPVVIYDPKSKDNFMSKKSKTVEKYDQVEATKQQAPAINEKASNAPTDNAGVAFRIREPFSLNGGPQSAINGLFVQMARYCPQGWVKSEEWVEPSEAGYFLHYQFQCTEYAISSD